MSFRNLIQRIEHLSSSNSSSMGSTPPSGSNVTGTRSSQRDHAQFSAALSPSLGLRDISSMSDSEVLPDLEEEESNRSLLNVLGSGTPVDVGGIMLNPTARAILVGSGDTQYDAVLNSLISEGASSTPASQEMSEDDMQLTPVNQASRVLARQDSSSQAEDPSGELGEIHSLLTSEAHLEWGDYPHPSRVINDVHFAGDLEDTGILSELRSIAYMSIASLGDMRLPDALGGLVLDPYNQVVLAVCHKFYASLPSLGMNIDSFKVLHYYRRVSAVTTPGMPVDDQVRNGYSELSDAGLEELMTKVSLLFLDLSQAQFSDLETGVSRLTLENRLTTVRQHLPQAYTVFNMLSHYCLGGIECIEPIPAMIKVNMGLSRYISAIARGTSDISTLTVSMTPRPSDRPVARYRPEAHAHQAQAQTQQPPAPTRELPPLIFSASGSTPVTGSRPITLPEVMPANTGTIQPPIRLGAATIIETGESSGDSPVEVVLPSATDLGPRQIHTVNNAPGSLLSQGDPGRTQIIRDTTNFRSGIQDRVDTSGELASMQTKIDMVLNEVRRMASMQSQIEMVLDESRRMATELTLCRNENEQMKQELQIMSRNYTELNRSFGSMIAQSSQHNLAERQLINLQLLQPQTQEGTQIMAAAPTITPAPANTLRTIIQRLEAYPASNESVDSLVNDLKALLEGMGKRDLARGVTVASLNNSMARARALSILRNAARA